MTDYIDPATLPDGWHMAECEYERGGRGLYYVSRGGIRQFEALTPWHKHSPCIVRLLEPAINWQPMPERWWARWGDYQGATVRAQGCDLMRTGVLHSVDWSGGAYTATGARLGTIKAEWFYDPATLPKPDPDADLIAAIRDAADDDTARALIARARGEQS